MNLISIFISIAFASYWMMKSTLAHGNGHVCQHDATELDRVMPDEYFDLIKDMGNDRKM